MSSGVRELRVWQEAVSLAGDVIRTLRQGTRRETKVVSDSLMATAVAVGSHIADGFGRHTTAEQRECYLAAKRALLKLETEMAVARHADILPPGSFTELTARSSHVAQLLGGYLAYLDRQLSEREGAGTGRSGAANPAASGAPPPGFSPDSARVPS